MTTPFRRAALAAIGLVPAGGCVPTDETALSARVTARLTAPIPAEAVAAAVRPLPEVAHVDVDPPEEVGNDWGGPVFGPGRVRFIVGLPGPVWWRTTVRQRVNADDPSDRYPELLIRLDWYGDGNQGFTPADRRRVDAEVQRLREAIVGPTGARP